MTVHCNNPLSTHRKPSPAEWVARLEAGPRIVLTPICNQCRKYFLHIGVASTLIRPLNEQSKAKLVAQALNL